MTSLNKSGIKLLKAQVVKKLSPPNNSKPSVESNIIKSSFVQKLENQYVIQNIINNENRIFKYKHFINLSSKDKVYDNVDFSFSIFDNAYFRDCEFRNCNFTGTIIKNSNFKGAKFKNCNFDYSFFEKTQISINILYENSPQKENIKSSFARNLRTNFQQLGDSRNVNRAILIELEATREHLKKICYDHSSHYRDKYKSWRRVKGFQDYYTFIFFDFIWGNGESLWKLLRSLLLLIVLINFVDFYYNTETEVTRGFNLLLGTTQLKLIPETWNSIFLLIRLLMMSLLTALIIKRISRR